MTEACRCQWLRRDLAAHRGLHERIEPDTSKATVLYCGYCGEAVAGRVPAASTGITSCVWTLERTWFGEFEIASPPNPTPLIPQN